MRLFASLEISSAGLAAQRTRLDTIATNIANAETTRTPEGGPYQRKRVVFREVLNQGVAGAGTVTDPTPGPRIYEPGHPDADAAGYVQMPNVQLPTEMVEMVSATRSYEANAAAVAAAKRMALKALEIGE